MSFQTISTSWPSYIVITPVRDEERHIKRTIESIENQKHRPVQWIIVNDGSTDETPQLIQQAADKHSWIKAIHIPNRGFRKPGGGVVEAFYKGYKEIDYGKWDFIVKLDGDLSFKSDYFERCFHRFKNEDKLGIGGGTVYSPENGYFLIDSKGDPPFHVRGATKIYRRECWNQIHPLLKAPGWDTIDEIRANRLNWTTRTFRNVNIFQHKATGSADGNWHNWIKNGLANYITGYHPLFMLCKCIRRISQKPILLASTALWTGFCSGYINNISQVDDAKSIRYLRIQQLRRLMLMKSIYG